MKKRFLKVLMMATTAVVLLSGCAGNKSSEESQISEEKTTILVGTMGTYSPFSYYDEENNLTGFDVEVVRMIEEKDPSLHFEFESGAWESLFPGLDSGKYQMLANQIASNEDRRAKYSITETSYFVSANQLIVRSDNDDITSLEDLAESGLPIGLTVGDNHNEKAEQWNEEHDAEHQLNIRYYNEDITTILQDIDNGRIAATLNNPSVAVSKAKIQGLAVKPVGIPVTQSPVYFIFAGDEEGEKLCARVNTILKELKDSGELAELSKKWFDADYTVLIEE